MAHKPVSEIIKDRIVRSEDSFFANDNISKYILGDELGLLQKEAEDKIESLLQSLIIDTENDHNTQETAKRMAKMYINEVFKGRYHSAPKATDFPNAKELDEIYTLGPISIRSACSHHMVPIIGQAWIGILPSDRVIGISKFNRIIDWVMSRPHIQEEAAIMVADEVEKLIKPKGFGLVIKAQHMCMSWRGVKEAETTMVNSVMRGEFRQNHVKSEFIELIKGQGYK